MFRFLISSLALLLAGSVHSQIKQGAGEASALQMEYLISLYRIRTGGFAREINGRDYFQYFTRSKLKPILFSDRESTGSITFRSGELKNVILQYDTFLDEVIYTDTTRYIFYPFCKIALNKSSFISFSLAFTTDTLIFRFYKSGDSITYNLKEGFYEVVYDGRTRFLIKHQSSVAETNSIKDYYYKPVYYLLRNNAYFRVKSSKKLIRLLAEESPHVMNYMRENNIKIRDAGKRQVVNILKYYDNQASAGGKM